MYEVVVRTIDGKRLLRPTADLTEGVLGILGRALRLYQVVLYAFTYLSNHAHLLLSAGLGDELAGFMCHVNRNTALLVTKLNGKDVPVWDRYRPIPILDDVASVRRLRYVLANGVKEGLVASPLDLPGPSSARALVTNTPIETSWKVWTPGRVKARSTVIETNSINLAPLPCWADLSVDARTARVRALVDDITEWGAQLRDGRPVLGIEGMLAQDPFAPVALEHTPPPVAHWSDPRALAGSLAEKAAFENAYLAASRARRRQRAEGVVFPPCGYPSPSPFRPGE